MRGWFDAFRIDGGPTLYAYSNRTSVTADIPIIVIFLTFITVYLGFLIIFPGIRKEKISTFCTVTLSLLTGIILSACNYSSDWEVGTGIIHSSYRAFSPQKIKASLGVSIGLHHANITLQVIPTDNRTLDIDFNERFYWNSPRDMYLHYHTALKKGLPYPILTAAEYLTLDEEGFMWGRAYRTAGYYTSIILWAGFALWLLSNILLVNVPRYGAYCLSITGFMMVLATIIYWTLKPQTPLVMRFEETIITFKAGKCYWITMVVGVIVGISGLIISIVDLIFPHKFSTILEIDFDTPYDRHIIIEDSLDTRKKFKIPRLEEPLNVGRTVGSRLLRRLSNRGKEPKEKIETNPGIDNAAFELESSQSKASWKSSFLIRSDSMISSRSINFRNSFNKTSNDIPDVHEVPLGNDITSKNLIRSISKQSISSSSNSGKTLSTEEELKPVSSFPNMKRQNSSHSCSSTSSYGLEMLNGSNSIRRESGEENHHKPVTRNNSGNIIVFHKTDSRGQLQRLSGEVVEIQTDDFTADW